MPELYIVYVLTNPAMPGIVKIGKTTSDEAGIRIAQLYGTGVPFPFKLEFAAKVPNADEVEQALHRAFAPHRVNPRREFFAIEPDQAIAILTLLHVQDTTEVIEAQPTTIENQEIAAGEEYRKRRRPNLNFLEMGIPIGSILNFTESDAVVRVIAAKKVELSGKEMSLTAATRSLLNVDYDVYPGPYWLFNGTSLKAIYNETYTSIE